MISLDITESEREMRQSYSMLPSPPSPGEIEAVGLKNW